MNPITEEEARYRALELLRTQFDGMSLGNIKYVLRLAEGWLNGQLVLDCSTNDFQTASEECARAIGK
ncbi:hypothetical protein [Burkholderia ambifaria]|uniref:hypothetical protein n=1 Tax=Burkholderia ambifaria TaxID=152480 RepID=UPI00158E1EFD|nr:hypothetical protein [Burkholderia ambifaria]MBR8346394.1 hypothetical protein [Burkholderia ambifaria]